MPLIRMQIDADVNDTNKREAMEGLSKIVSRATGKPETYIMVTINFAPVCMAGSCGRAAFLEVMSIGGLSKDVNTEITKEFCALLDKLFSIVSKRVYVSFSDVQGVNFGCDNKTFA